jgi:pimeloyl-ACP methyl ester carboxylesterase
MTTALRTTDLHVEVWGEGTRVVLVHGSLAVGDEEWAAQQPLAEEGYQLVVPDRRGCGRSPAAVGEDFLRDADDIAALMGDGAHLVGHSYGGLGVLFAAAARPEVTRSVTLLEPGALGLDVDAPAAKELVAAVRDVWDRDAPDEEWVVDFLVAVGSDPSEFPPEFLAAALPLVPVFRNGRPILEADLPLAAVAAGAYPKLVVSGGHNAGFDAICDELAARIGARRAEVPGAGHEIQFTGDAINAELRALWSAS